MGTYASKLSDKKYASIPEIDRTSKAFTRAKIPNSGNLKILDVGCGTGVNAAYFSKMGHNVFGVDISQIAIEKFKKAGFKGCQCDITQGIPVEDETFDIVYASEVIEHIDDYPRFISELFRVLKKDGTLILSTINSAFWPFRMIAVIGKTLSDVQHPGHIRFFTRNSLSKAIEHGGFTQIKISARHMYLILSGTLFEKIETLLKHLPLIKEMRFKTMRPFWHYSRYSEKASCFWADTLIVTASKK